MGIKVFLVQGTGNVHSLWDEVFRDDRYDCVGTATTEAEAKRWLEERRGDWEVAVIDLMLAQGSGFGVISRARKTHPTGCVVVLSGHLSEDIEKHCLKLGADVVFDRAHSRDFARWANRVADLRVDRASHLAAGSRHSATDRKPARS